MTVFQLNNLITKWNARSSKLRWAGQLKLPAPLLIARGLGFLLDARVFTTQKGLRSPCRPHLRCRTETYWPLSRAVRTMLIAEGAMMS